MKAAPFTYHRPSSLDEALALLAEYDDAKVLAGGQSLVPLMALRMGKPEHVVDLGAVPGLDRITVGDDGSVSIGAMVRHEQAKRSPEIAQHAPLIRDTMPWVAHRAIRTRGTVVGSIAHADPAAEMPAAPDPTTQMSQPMRCAPAFASRRTVLVRVSGERSLSG